MLGGTRSGNLVVSPSTISAIRSSSSMPIRSASASSCLRALSICDVQPLDLLFERFDPSCLFGGRFDPALQIEHAAADGKLFGFIADRRVVCF